MGLSRSISRLRATGSRRGLRICVAVWLLLASAHGAPPLPAAPSEALGPAAPPDALAAASAPSPPWDGPQAGPPGSPGRSVAVLAEDLRNGGVLGVALGVREAVEVMGWTIKVFDAAGTPEGRARAAADALAARPDGLVLVGSDAEEMRPLLRPLSRRGVPVVGWHVGPRAGAMAEGPVAVNVSTDPVQVGRMAATAAIAGARGDAGVVIFTDSTFEIATTKSRVMAEVVEACGRCSLLEVHDIPISRCAEEMPALTRELLARHGDRWTHALAINDIYFDYSVPELILAGRPHASLGLYSAGDGSSSAFMRIQAGLYQEGTVAEPLALHGWQLVDELNRLLAGGPVSGYVVPVHVVTRDNIAYDGGPALQYDPANGYRDAYRQIWRR